eukprot:COSAG01_NODE_1824_length_9141_cov_10.234461_3_plen_139_part_00
MADAVCSCAVYCSERQDCRHAHGRCWKRRRCDPERFEKDAATADFTTYYKNDQPPPPPPPAPPPPSHARGALAYLKHDAMGPRGDVAILVFNPGMAQQLTIDLSMLPGERPSTAPLRSCDVHTACTSHCVHLITYLCG